MTTKLEITCFGSCDYHHCRNDWNPAIWSCGILTASLRVDHGPICIDSIIKNFNCGNDGKIGGLPWDCSDALNG